MARMSSPNGDEVLTVSTDVGANVLRSLGWSQEGGSSGGSSGTGSATSESETPTKRRPGRPKKSEQQPSESESRQE